ncbi:hypothetical protein BHF68_13970 [Desulfuribacillus alkaliarsenatis]|uniref:DNA/RNA helicase n=1 Tax=Desulfuribacillus alkaliarsenatis TaxID=766136 RepID=A0A1E5G3N2_9FIRM|nr:hypothetical protein BHF68_13970 [Desulfuribacillus alkaliarsenatis]
MRCSPVINFDEKYEQLLSNTDMTKRIEKLTEGLAIHEAYKLYPELLQSVAQDSVIAIDQELDIIIDKDLESIIDKETVNKTIELIGIRRLTMPEIHALIKYSLIEYKEVATQIINELIQELYLKKLITIQPAIQQDDQGRLFCLRCLQTEKISKHECGACQSDDCYVCLGCTSYGEVRSCIPIIKLTTLGLEKLNTYLQHQVNKQHQISEQYHFNEEHQLNEQQQLHKAIYPHPLSEEQLAVSRELAQLVEAGQDTLVWAVCGAGKTEMVFEAIAMTRNSEKRVLIATPRKDVVLELVPRLQKAFPQDIVHAVYGGSVDKHIIAGITIATTHQLLRYCDNAFDVVIIDEIDAFPYAGDAMLYQHAHRLGSQFIYMTATPDRQMLKRVKQKEVSVVTLFQRYHGKPLPEPALYRCNGLFAQGLELTIKKLFNNTTTLSFPFEWVLKQLPTTGVTMFFVPSIFQGRELLETLQTYISRGTQSSSVGVDRQTNITFVHAKDPEREQKIKDLRAGKYQWIITTTILERGVTIPDSHVVVIDAHHQVYTKSTLIQIAGRVGRTEKHPEGKVYFLTEHVNDNILSAIKEIKKINRAVR